VEAEMNTSVEDVASDNEQQVVFQPSFFNCSVICGEGVKWPGVRGHM